MSGAVFGKAISRTFIADDGIAPIQLPTQTPTIYVFDSCPSYASAQDGTGAIKTVNSWTQSGIDPSITYLVPAIEDPTPSGPITQREYFEAINYKLEALGTTQTKIRSFTVRRADAADSKPGTLRADVKRAWPGISNWVKDSEIDDFLSIAEAHLRADIEAQGKEYGRVYKLAKTKLALAYKTAECAAASQVARGAQDKFVWAVEYYGGQYQALMGQLELPADSDGDGVPDVTVKPDSNFRFSGK